jgi:hypothetical protein
MRLFMFLFVAMMALSFADQMATTSSGVPVILHDNGRWEFYQNNAKVRDVRESTLPADAKTTISIQYESYEKLRKNMRMKLEADLAPEEEIQDSLRTLPKGGIIHFCVPTKELRKAAPRIFTYTIWMGGEKPLYQATISDEMAVPSEEAGVSHLLSVPVYGRPKVKQMTARVENKVGKQTLDFDIPIP